VAAPAHPHPLEGAALEAVMTAMVSISSPLQFLVFRFDMKYQGIGKKEGNRKKGNV
jgi:hypothetical protein